VSKRLDLTGWKFGKLFVESFREIKNSITMWNCLCDCGNRTIVRGVHLKNGNTKSCGCTNSDRLKSLALNLVGERFGRWTVLKRNKKSLNRGDKSSKTFWDCKCDCGNIGVVSGGNLKSGTSKSCGCRQKELVGASKFIDLKNKKFGILTVKKIYGKNKHKRLLWECSCECGNKCVVAGTYLANGDTKSCGCMRESYVALYLKNYFINKNNAKTEYKIIKNKKTNIYLPFDIYLPSENIYIEINGLQHYKFIPFYHRTVEKFYDSKKRDKIKKSFARANGMYIEIDLRKIKKPEEAILYIESFM
jgi:hypothetical protein